MVGVRQAEDQRDGRSLSVVRWWRIGCKLSKDVEVGKVEEFL
jgi:hypothetical protein